MVSDNTTVSFTHTRKAITTRLREHCAAHGLTYDATTADRGKGPQLIVTIDGIERPPGPLDRQQA